MMKLLARRRLRDLLRFGDDERGQTLVEYGLLLALITLVVVAALIVLGPLVSGFFNDFGQSVQDVT